MDQETKKLIDGLTREVAALTKTVGDLKKTTEELKNDQGEVDYIGPYAAGTPTADGTIPFQIAGQRYNLLVDKV